MMRCWRGDALHYGAWFQESAVRVLVLTIFAATAVPSAFAKTEPTPIAIALPKNSAYALGGYDAVAPFVVGQAVRGNPKYQTRYAGAVWLFASQDNLDRFLKEPDRYLPAYGGNCALSLARGNAVPSDGRIYTIEDNRLVLHKLEGMRNRWQRRHEENKSRADYAWSVLADGAATAK